MFDVISRAFTCYGCLVAIVWAFLCVLSPPGLPAVRAQVLGLLKGELDARPGRGRGRWVGIGWVGFGMAFL